MWFSSLLTTVPDAPFCEDDFWGYGTEQEENSESDNLLLKDTSLSRRDLWIALTVSLLLHGSVFLFAAAMNHSQPVPSDQTSYITVELIGGGGEGGSGGLGQGGRKEAGENDLPAGGSGETKNPGEKQKDAELPALLADWPADGIDSTLLESGSLSAPLLSDKTQSLPSPQSLSDHVSDKDIQHTEIDRSEPDAPPTLDGPEAKSPEGIAPPPPAPKPRHHKRIESNSAATIKRKNSETKRSKQLAKKSNAQPGSDTQKPTGASGPASPQTGKGARGNAAGDGIGEAGGTGIGGRDGIGVAAGGSGKVGGTFSLKQVDRPPKLLRGAKPKYPKTAHDMHITGKVVVKFLVTPDGHVSNAKVMESSPHGVFDQSVLESLSKWRFRPGCYHNKAVATWVIVPVSFKLTKD